MAARTFCCAHPQPRIDSPEPPARPPATIDAIFAAAALPADHPHALKLTKKPEEHASIIRSPSMASKLKHQFRRKSMKTLRKDQLYDEDALPMTSAEVVQNVGQCGREDQSEGGSVAHHLKLPSRQEDFRTSVFSSLDWWKPRFSRSDSRPDIIAPVTDLSGRPSSLTLPKADETATTAGREPSRSRNSVVDRRERAAKAPLPQSLSSPNLMVRKKRASLPLRRTQSFLGLNSMLTESPPRPKTVSGDLCWQASSRANDTPQMDGADSPRSNSSQSTLKASTLPKYVDEELKGHASRQSEHFHLHTMDIHHQLRSMSAMSDDTAENDSLLSPHHTWNFHHRERRNIIDPSAFSRHTHMRSTTNSHDIGRVLSPAASSVYSRPSSFVSNENERKELVDRPPYVIPNVDGALTDWPLQPTVEREAVSTANLQCVEGNTGDQSASGENGDKGAETPSKGQTEHEPSSARRTPRTNAASLRSKPSMSTLTSSSKRSRLLQRVSPPKKAVRKRRSIFKFLRAGSRKAQDQVRSISSPILRAKPSQASGLYDGPANDPALLTVQYELTENPQHMSRAASVSNLSGRRATSPHLPIPDDLERRPSLAEYEKHLTAAGDDRRRPSSVNLQKLQEVQEDDRRESLLLNRKLSRAKPLADDTSGLMAQALEKHQQEKALFRSASKQRESLHPRLAHCGQDHPHPHLFRTDTLTSSSSMLLPSIAVHDEPVDPSDRQATRPLMQLEKPSKHSGMLQASATSSLGYASRASSHKTTAPRRLSSAPVAPEVSLPARQPKRIGTILDSWARFPSHTRTERCGSAGKPDQVITRDFAPNIRTDDPQILEEGLAASPTSKSSSKSKRLPRSRSTMFSGLSRYYSNIFSSESSTGQNRRTSVVKGGWLANPDLELLPPPTSNEPTFPHHDHGFKQHLHALEHELEEAVRKDVEYVESEAHKLSQELRHDVDVIEKEAERFEDEVRKEVELVEEEAEWLEEHVKKDVELVEAEAEKLIHHHNHNYPSTARQSLGSNLFRKDSLFRATPHHPRLKRDSTFMDPLEEVQVDSDSQQPSGERSIALDGTAETRALSKDFSKAQLFSDLYQECLARPESAGSHDIAAPPSKTQQELPPPALKPAKPRSPEQPKQLDPQSSIRRFPSATVIDDRKGHSRSVSLISVKVGAEGGLYRSSTNDLLHLMQEREREERERLLSGFGSNV